MAPVNKKDYCFILLPGFSPDNFPVLGIKKQLEDLGYDTIATSFWGTNEKVNFSALTYEECERGITSLVASACERYKYVIGIGISLGGALLLEQAKKNRKLHCVVSIGTPFKLLNRWLIALGLACYPVVAAFWRIRVALIHEKRPLPIGSAKMVVKYLEGGFLENLPSITVPVLLLHSQNDTVTDYRCVDHYVSEMQSQKKQVIYLNDTDHVIKYDGQLILRLLFGFLNNDEIEYNNK